MSRESTKKSNRISWIYAALPVALATGQIGTIVQLHLIDINGQALGTIYAGLASAFFNGVAIPAAIFWGFVTDRFHARKGILVSSYIVMAVALVSFFFEQNTVGTISEYSAFSFISTATATPLNLLIMETEPKNQWADYFAKLSFSSGIGTCCGLIASTIWSNFLPLIDFTVPLGFASLASAVLATVLIREPPLVLEKETIARRKQSFFTRLRTLPIFFIAVPTGADFKRVFRGLRSGLTSYTPLLYLSIVLFSLSGGVFNPSWVPALYSLSFGSGPILLIILIVSAVQTFVFEYAGKYVAARSLVSVSITWLAVRGSCYAALGLSLFFFKGYLYVIPALTLYTISSGIAYAFYYTASNTMVFNSIQNRSPGSTLGVYSALVGIATTSGSLVSGFISVYFGFDVTFVAAGLLLGASVLVLFQLKKHVGSLG
ncbi:MAG TPA: hypothetical protein VEJ36_05075 [Nitrososphaerales archaeon]|nr:hypothetical protein [Nitrososphaerales archaeon]